MDLRTVVQAALRQAWEGGTSARKPISRLQKRGFESREQPVLEGKGLLTVEALSQKPQKYD